MWWAEQENWFSGRLAVVALSAAGLLSQPVKSNAEALGEPEVSGVRIQVDNDLFAGHDTDRDYTGGFGVTVSGQVARENALSLDPLLSRIDAFVGMQRQDTAVWHAQQLGLLAFTPKDIATSQAQQDDRPYASLAFVAS